jgi:hypothetical protein
MLASLSDVDLARILPGSWVVAATNFPFWLSGTRLEPTLTYSVTATDPLVLDDLVRYTTETGAEKTIAGVDRASRGGFTWHGRGLLRPLRSRWQVTGSNKAETVVGVRYAKSLVTSAGIDMLVRAGSDVDPRSIVAVNAEAYGLTLEEFASLTWLPRGGPAAA